MKAEENSAAALMEVCGSLPVTMQGVLLDFTKGLLAINHQHAAAVASLTAQVDDQRAEIETLVAKCAELEDTIGALGNGNEALEREAASLREMNGALIAERSAAKAVEAAVARYAELKHHVDALLAVADASAATMAPRVAAHADPSERETRDVEESAAPALSELELVVADDAQSESAGNLGGTAVRALGKAGGRHVVGDSPIPS
jgi:hypothetical protein